MIDPAQVPYMQWLKVWTLEFQNSTDTVTLEQMARDINGEIRNRQLAKALDAHKQREQAA